MNKFKTAAMSKMGADRTFINTIALLVISIVAMAVTFGVTSFKTKHGKEYVELAGEQRVLSQRIAKYAFEAARGEGGGPPAYRQWPRTHCRTPVWDD